VSSTTSSMPLWGQAWELTVTYATESGDPDVQTIGSSDWEPESLRITFDVLQAMNTDPFWYADISIYNMNDQAVQNTLLNATWATLKAGFQVGSNLYTTIWDGPVFQSLFTRENVVDQKVTLHCVANPLIMSSIVNFNIGPASQAQLAARLASEVSLPPLTPGQGTMSQLAYDRMSAKQYPRGRTVYGKVGRYIAQLADDNFMQSWRDGQQVYVSEVSKSDTTPDLIYSPPIPPGYTAQQLGLPNNTTTSIIGTPRQIQQGVIFTVLLDPRLVVKLPPLVVQLTRTQVALLQRTPSINDSLPTVLDANLKFFVAQVRHTGDTRGNDWQTEITGYSTTYADNLLNGIFAPNSLGG
jgi:hypothetical protein